MATKKGKCRLCKRTRELQDSHFMGRTLYKKLREESLRNPSPIVIAGESVDQSDAQLKDFVFCLECEDIFNKRGEMGVHRWVATWTDFPLLKLFEGVPPARTIDTDFRVYDGEKVPGLEYDRLFHYGAGIFFKAACHVWNAGGNTSHIEINWDHREALRKTVYYRDAPLPKSMRMTIAIASMQTPFAGMFPPVRIIEPRCSKYSFYVPGIFYTLYVGKHIPEIAKLTAGNNEIEKPVYLMPEASEGAREIMKVLASNARRSPRVEQLIRTPPPPRR
jgi:hypothetical protein